MQLHLSSPSNGFKAINSVYFVCMSESLSAVSHLYHILLTEIGHEIMQKKYEHMHDKLLYNIVIE